MWPCHSANGRAWLRFQPKRREGTKEGGREGDKHLSVLMIWTASRYRLHFWVCCYWQHFVWAVWVFGWHTLRREGIPALGRIQECAREQSEERRREDSSSFFPLHLCLCRRFVSERMGAGALTICVSRNLKAGSWLLDSPVSHEVGGLGYRMPNGTVLHFVLMVFECLRGHKWLFRMSRRYKRHLFQSLYMRSLPDWNTKYMLAVKRTLSFVEVTENQYSTPPHITLQKFKKRG